VVAEYRRLETSRAAAPGCWAVGAVLAARERLRWPHLDAVLRSVDRLNRGVASRLLLGIENRFHPHKIRCTLAGLLQEFRGGAVRYWHDGPRANHQRQRHRTAEAWSEAFGPGGCTHLYDTAGQDPRAGMGSDFTAILRHLPADYQDPRDARASARERWRHGLPWGTAAVNAPPGALPLRVAGIFPRRRQRRVLHGGKVAGRTPSKKPDPLVVRVKFFVVGLGLLILAWSLAFMAVEHRSFVDRLLHLRHGDHRRVRRHSPRHAGKMMAIPII
jgi:hypothetical protein